ncbi:Scr1 family TA system antitoxin-like transcriptional regulator [Actinomycetota bacterium Odt1-20B]
MHEVESELGWDVEPGEEVDPAVEALGHLQKRRRQAAGLSVVEFADAVGYGEDQIRKVERGARIPRPEYLDKADEVLGANGMISGLKEDLAKARYPKKVRKLAKLEQRAVELSLYSNHNLHGLLQTKEYAEALFRVRRPTLSHDELEQALAARLDRQSIFDRSPAPDISFVQEEWHHPGPGSRASGVAGLHRASAGRNMSLKPTVGDTSWLDFVRYASTG